MGIGAYAAIVGGLFMALWRYPAVALAGVLCMFGLEQWGQATTTFFAQHQTATNLLIGGLLMLALTIQLFRKGFTMLAGYPLVGWLVLALFVYAFASAQWAPRADISLDLWATRWPYVMTFIVLSPLLITTSQDLRAANVALLITGGTLTLLLLFFLKWENRLIVLGHGVGNPLAVSTMAGMVALIAILADPWPESKLWIPIKWPLILVCISLVVRSASRGQLLGVLIVSVACLPISRRLHSMKQFVVLGLLVVFLAGVTSWAIEEFSSKQTYGNRESRWSGEGAKEDVYGRLNNAIRLVQLAYESPETTLLGLGNSASYDPRILGIYPHFVPLEVLAEEGIIGFVLYVLILYSLLKSIVRSYRLAGDHQSDRLLLGGLIGLCMFTLLLSFKQGSLLGNLEFFMLAIILSRYEGILSKSRVLDHVWSEFDERPGDNDQLPHIIEEYS
ncbi:MAG: O-antigen ligase family protein [Nitrospira sp.]|nr:O-antigen ligase family protein [Nitrospira sp.]